MSDANMAAESSWLLNKLAGLAIEVEELTDEDTRALYLAAAAKAGAAPVQQLQVASAAAGSKKKAIRWQKWALTAAAALLVCTAGVLGLASGGFGMSASDNAAPEMAMDVPEAEMFMYGIASSTATAEEPATAPEENKSAVTGDADTRTEGGGEPVMRNDLTGILPGNNSEMDTDSTTAESRPAPNAPAGALVLESGPDSLVFELDGVRYTLCRVSLFNVHTSGLTSEKEGTEAESASTNDLPAMVGWWDETVHWTLSCDDAGIDRTVLNAVADAAKKANDGN